MGKYVYFNGDIISENEVRISPRDLGFLRGYGVMDAMKTINGKPFLAKEHFDRLINGVKFLNLNTNISLIDFKNTIEKLLIKNNIKKDIAIKITITGGVSSNGLKIDGDPTILITINNLENVAPTKNAYDKGVDVISAEFQRAAPLVKTTNYIFALQQQEVKESAQATEVIYKKNDILLEGSTSNIFIIKNGVVITPNQNILMGTMRNFVLDLIKNANIKVEEREVKFRELLGAEEAFLTGTFKNILPVRRVDGIIIGDGKVGTITKRMIKRFKVEIKN